MNIHIYYRHTNILRTTQQNRPAWFSHRQCFKNLINTIVQSKYYEKVKFNFVFDGIVNDLEQDPCSQLLKNEYSGFPYSERIIQGGNQRAAWRKCMQLVKDDCDNGTINNDDIIYFLENDYLHKFEWIEDVFSLSNSNIDWDLITLYDHPDKYANYCVHPDAQKNKYIKSSLFVCDGVHWRTVPSTCATYLLRKDKFIKYYNLLKLGIYDYKLFFIMTKVLRNKLVSPVPSLSTHCMQTLLAPIVNWEEINDK